jgi:hypothetical protein
MKRFALMLATAVVASAITGACSSSTPEQADPCPSGICGDPPEGVDGATVNDGQTTADGGCAASWACTPWSTGGSGNKATRTCTDTKSCPTATAKPIESVDLPPLDLELFKCKVMPLLQAKCSQLGCHGTETDRPLRGYARGRLRHAGETIKTTCQPTPGTDRQLAGCTGSIECECGVSPHTATEVQLNFDGARGFALDADGNALAPGQEASSDLIAQAVIGGKAHAGVHVFKTGDPDEQALRDWISGKKLGQACVLGNNYN